MLIIIAVLILASAASAAAQEQNFRSFVKGNAVLISADAAAKIADGLYTRRALEGATVHYGCGAGCIVTWHPSATESNPLARPFVKTNAGAAAFFASEFAGDVGAAYLLHKHGHSKWAKAMLALGVGYSAEGAAVSAHAYYSF